MKCPKCGHHIRVDADTGGLVARNARKTSRKAAMTVNAGTQRCRVLLAIAEIGHGYTDEECGVALGLTENSVRPRRLELVELGLVEDSGVTRKTKRANDAVVWAATLAGFAEARRLDSLNYVIGE